MLVVKPSRWGNSLSIRIPKKIADVIGMLEHDEWILRIEGNRLILKKKQEEKTIHKTPKKIRDGGKE
jgi:antitoxin MazE